VSLSSETYARAREILASDLSEASLAHCERVAATARVLAVRFGVDPDLAALAGLLHDRSRDESDAELLASANELGLATLPIERERPYLLHARVAAERARRELPGLDERVVAAIEAHTVGSAEMTDLDKVVYLADMIEPARTYPGVEDLRRECSIDSLAECFRDGYGRALRDVIDKGRPVHPVSTAVLASIERETGRPLAVQETRT
jgi:predicted HD superfamily hydrolase involved in NAD metabolism